VNPFPFNNRYVSLGEPFYQRIDPTPVAKPGLIQFNHDLARELGLPADIVPDDVAEIFSGNRVPEGAEPLAMAYAGHQFGNFVPQLGDGRAILLGEISAPDGRVFEMQLKGSGRTQYSRNGDGRAALGPVVREYLVSEAMARLGVPTTRALAAVTTGEDVARERFIPGGVITRIASSFVRVGTFQYFAAKGDVEAIRVLADHVISRNYAQLRDAENVYAALLQAVVERQADLIARWMHLGFIHGVMNTDNMSIAGETIDYGPCAFMDTYAHGQVFSSIDQLGRYAYNNQPGIGLWNLTRLAESLVPLLNDDSDKSVEMAQGILETYIPAYEDAWLAGMRTKCGLTGQVDSSVKEGDKSLIEELLNTMADGSADFTLTFHYLSRLGEQPSAQDEDIRRLFDNPKAFDEWAIRWRERLAYEAQNDKDRQSAMQSVNPVYIPRNHQIEAAIRAAEDRNDFTVFYALHEVLQNPFERQDGKEQYQLPPEPEEVVHQTFCGT
jgi:uncharacterized protein YdiU (UPF0061 family)